MPLSKNVDTKQDIIDVVNFALQQHNISFRLNDKNMVLIL